MSVEDILNGGAVVYIVPHLRLSGPPAFYTFVHAVNKSDPADASDLQ
jgi:hypothetical protein